MSEEQLAGSFWIRGCEQILSCRRLLVSAPCIGGDLYFAKLGLLGGTADRYTSIAKNEFPRS